MPVRSVGSDCGAIGVTLATEALLSPGLLTLFSRLGVLSLITILVLHLLLVLIGQLKLLVLFLLLALVLNKSRYVLRKYVRGLIIIVKQYSSLNM